MTEQEVIEALLSRRYLVYNVDDYYPRAALNDVIGAFATKEEAFNFADSNEPNNTIYVIDNATGEEVYVRYDKERW
jgi:predicted HAD superfamily phosphohydrolase